MDINNLISFLIPGLIANGILLTILLVMLVIDVIHRMLSRKKRSSTSANEVLSGHTTWVNGKKVTGSVSNSDTITNTDCTVLSDLDTYIFASNNILQSRFIYECKVDELPKNMTLNEFNEAVIASINYTCRASTGLGDIRFSGYIPLRANQNLTFFVILDVRKGINPASIVTDLTSRSTIASFSIISIRPIVDDDQIRAIIQNIANEYRNAIKGGE